MKCTLNPNIKSASGKFGNLLFKTFSKPDGTKEIRAYGMPRRKDGSFGYERKAKPSAGEIAARKLIGLKDHFLQRHSVKQITNTIIRIHLSIPVI